MVIDLKQNPLVTAIKQDLAKNKVREGDIIDGIFIKLTSRGAFFDLGKFGTGIVYGLELLNAKEVIKKLKVGDKIPVKIIVLENENGLRELSLIEAGQQKSWQKVKELEESGETIKMKIIGANSGGLIGEVFGLKAFLPISKLSFEHFPNQVDKQKIVEELKKFIGQEFNVKISSVNQRSNKLIVSERDVITSNISEFLSRYKTGQIVEGVVSGIANFGVLVRLIDNPQIEGVVYLSELDYRVIDNPKDILKQNDVVRLKILEIKDGKLILSIKATKPDPWENIGEKYKEGQEVVGVVYKFTPFGAIINLEDIQGVIHITDFGGMEEMKQSLEIGKSYHFYIFQTKPEEKRLILKLKK